MTLEELHEMLKILSKLCLSLRTGDIFVPMDKRVTASFRIEVDGYTVFNLHADDMTLDRMANDE